MNGQCDFSGWATRVNIKCADGRIIRKNAFIDDDGATVPIVWNHQHDSEDRVLGHALLENRDDGVYAYGYFNDTESGQTAKLLVQHGDIDSLSIYANRLKQQGPNVIHGCIRELSLVLAGANPGAYIDTVMAHGEDAEGEGTIYSGETLDYVDELFHSESGEKKGETEVAANTNRPESDETVEDVFNTLSPKQKQVVYAMIGQALAEANGEEDDEDDEDMQHAYDGEETIADVFDTFTDEQKDAVYAMLGQALEEAEMEHSGMYYDDYEDDYGYDGYEDDYYDDYEGGAYEMKHNVFDTETDGMDVLSHDEMTAILEDAKRNGSLKDAFLAHGIEDIDYLFPDAHNLDTPPSFIKRDDDWVAGVMGAVHNTPFSRIKSMHADITEADARAKGYVKGNMKIEEVFTLLKRTTTPTTIYKKQKMDKDDIIDITDFDVIAWLKTEMRMMLNEEIARAILVGDGRTPSSNDKINEQNIRPIWTDDDVYTVKAAINVAANATNDEKAKAFIKACIKSRKNYKGSGNPVMYMTEDMLTDCLLLEDVNGRVIYDSEAKLATALRVSKIVTVPVMEGLTRVVGSNTHALAGIYVNLKDYNVGADKGGAINMFDDFDLDYNQNKYLIETRCSGALTVPFSAVALEFVTATPAA